MAAPSQGQWFQRAIRQRDDDVLIGDVGFCLADAQAEFGITLAPAAQGNGYAREALHALFGWLFGELGIHRVHASVDPRNAPSMALLLAMGMRKEAHFRESLRFHGEWVDDVVFGLLTSEWLGKGAGNAASRYAVGVSRGRPNPVSSNSFGKLFTVTTFGESHGPAIGCVIDGCPPPLAIAPEEFRHNLDRRATGKSRHTSQRREADEVEILSGVYEGKTTGTPIA